MATIINDLTIKIGGEAGQGVESSGAGFARAVARGGLYLFGLQDYMSRIRGGLNFFQIRIAQGELYTHTESIQLLLPFSREAFLYHNGEVVPGGAVLFDAGLGVEESELRERGVQAFSLPLVKIAEEQGGSRIMMNTAALGAAAGVTEYDFERIAEVITENFGRKGSDVAERNLKVARYAYDLARDRFAALFPWKLVPTGAAPRMVINGNQAFALGALAGGCNFIAAYPMTPATSIVEWLAQHAAQYGIVTKHTEDEISAVAMALGAAHVGARAMTATSGGGFSLMVETLGLAGMTETPLVIVDAQRGGPSTGLPTRTEQSDLEFLLHASHGEFPRILIAPHTVEEAFHTGYRAFNLAERYQCPVIVATDFHLANAIRSVDPGRFDIDQVEIDRGALMPDQQLDQLTEGYRRHLPTDSGVSPRAIPGHPSGVYITTGDEHTAFGYITEEAGARIQQMEKRMRKLETAEREMRLPERFGPEEADITLIGWGSTYGSLRETVERLNARGVRANLLHFLDLWPFPEERVSELLSSARYLVNVEQNFTGQLARVVRANTGRKVDASILKYDGRPISSEFILANLREQLGLPGLREEVAVNA